MSRVLIVCCLQSVAHLGAENGIGECDLNVRVDGGALAPQLRMVLGSDVNVKVAALAALTPRVALPPHAQAAATVNA